jgi:integrase
MSPFRRSGSPSWYVRHDVPGVGNITLSTKTKSKALAQQYDKLVRDLRALNRIDVLHALKLGEVTLSELHQNRLPDQLDALMGRLISPELHPLVDEFLKLGGQDTGLRDRSMRRYATSWKRVRALLPPRARLGDVNTGFVAEFKRRRHADADAAGKPLSAATLNRDLAAIGAFLRWCVQEKGIKVDRPALKYQRESKGRLVWLSSGQLAAFHENCPAEWQPLFELLFSTGMTISEALGLCHADIDLKKRRVSIHEESGRKLKRESRARELSFPERLVPLLERQFRTADDAPDARVFAFTYWTARKAWIRVCEAAKIHGATIHDARHTYAVHAVQSGIPEARLQKLLGHAHPGTTRRYAMHAPEQFLDDDADRIAKHMEHVAPAPKLELLA